MDTEYECPILLARCVRALPCTLDEFSQRCQAFMAELVALHAGFSGLHFVRAGDPRKPPALAADFSNLKEGLLSYGWNSDRPQAYTELDTAQRPTDRSVGDFHFSLSNWQDFDHKFDISISTSPKTYLPTNCHLDFPRLEHPEFRTGPLGMQIFELVIKHWPVRYASYATRGWNNQVNSVGPVQERQGCFELGWHTYVDDASVAEHLPADVPVRRVGQGILFSLFEDMPDFKNVVQVERGRSVRAALESAGKLKLYPDA